MKTSALLFIALLLLAAAEPAAGNPVPGPWVKVYFDEDLQYDQLDCPGPGLDTLYVVVEYFGSYISGVEYMIFYPPAMTFVADIVPYSDPVITGQSNYGINITYTTPIIGAPYGTYAAVVQHVLVQWNCNDCSFCGQLIEVGPNLWTGYLRVFRYPDMTGVMVEGEASTVCPCVGTKQTTWGNIKSLYTQ